MDEQSIFAAALERESESERGRFLQEACGNDSALRRRVNRLLKLHDGAGSFLDAPAGQLVAATTLAPQADLVGTKIGPYTLREMIGEGGFGVVYVAEQQEPVARKVALKIIKPGMDTREVIARFEAERQVLALMDHPNIAKVLDAGTTGGEPEGVSPRSDLLRKDLRGLTPLGSPGRPYFVMELVRGVPVTDYCDERQLDIRERLALFVDICRAVQHAHQKGIIHRDLKPSNVMVTLRDDRPIVKVIDFGVAKALSRRLTDKTVYTAYGQMIGTPLYMSPEQAQLNETDVDTRSDVYSLGVLLYELLTGTTPFDGATLQKAGFDEMRRIIREDEPPRPSARVSTMNAQLLSTVSQKHHTDPRRFSRSLRGELDWIAMTALEKDRTRRYESASAFAADVERYLHDDPVQACPPSVGYQLRKFVRRHRVAVWFGAVVASAVLVIAGLSTGFAIQQHRTATDLANANETARRALLESQRHSAELAFEMAVSDSDRGDLELGLQRFVHALDAAPKDAADLRQAIRTNLSARARPLAPIVALLRHDASVTNLECSPDGKTVITGAGDGTLRVWDAQTGKFLNESQLFQSPVGSIIFSPDGKTVAVSSGKLVRLWQPAAGKTLGGELRHDSRVARITFSPDGRRLATVERGTTQHFPPTPGGWGPERPRPLFKNQRARLWDVQTGKPIGRPLEHDERQGLYAAVFSPDGNVVMTLSEWISDVPRVRFWNAADGKPLGEFDPVIRHEKSRRRVRTGLEKAATFSADGHTAIVIYSRYTWIWDVDAKKLIGEPVKTPNDMQVTACSHDGEIAVIAAPDGKGGLWKPRSNEFTPLAVKIHDSGRTLFSPDDRYLAIRPKGNGGACELWKTESGKRLGRIEYGGDGIWKTSFSADGKSLLVTSGRRYQVWDVATVKPLGTAVTGETAKVVKRTVALNGRMLATLTRTGVARLWQATAPAPQRPVFRHKRGRGKGAGAGIANAEVGGLYLTPDGNTLVTICSDNTIWRWHARTGKPLGPPIRIDKLPRAGPIFPTVVFSEDGSLMATGYFNSVGFPPINMRQRVMIWNVGTGKSVSGPFGEHIHPKAFLDDGETLLCTDQRGRPWLYDSQTGKPLQQLLETDAKFVAVSPNGKYLLTSMNTLKLWTISARKPSGKPLPLPAIFEANQGRATFSRDGGILAVAGRDNAVRLFDVHKGQPIGRPLYHQVLIHELVFSPDGKTLVTACIDDTVRLWNTRTGEQIGATLPHPGHVHAIVFGPDGRLLATAGRDKYREPGTAPLLIRLWDPATGRSLGAYPSHGGDVYALIFSRDGKSLIAGLEDETARYWPVPQPLGGSAEEIRTWLRAVTGRDVSRGGQPQRLDENTWRAARRKLRKTRTSPFETMGRSSAF